MAQGNEIQRVDVSCRALYQIYTKYETSINHFAYGARAKSNKMKAKIIIENGETTIELKPENEFDTEIVEKLHDHEDKFNIHTETTADYSYGNWQNHRLILNIKETK